MKRSAYDEDDLDTAADATCVVDGGVTSDGRSTEKRQRSAELPVLVGPLTFAPDGSRLQQAVVPLGQSNMPGVHRVQARAAAPVRLWIPQQPSAPLETDSRTLFGAVHYESIFMFDTRASDADPLLGAPSRIDALVATPAVQKYGVVVSRHAPSSVADVRLPYVQDPTGAIMAECHVYEYLGPSAVCIRNGELLGSMMLQRAPKDVLDTLQRWA